MKRAFRINTPHIVYDIIEEETILINLKNGNYYNIDKYGSVIWEILAKSGDIDLFIDVVTQMFHLPAERTKADIGVLITDLLAENLIVPLKVEENSQPPMNENSIKATVSAKMTDFQCPVLNKYSDMRDALMLDPIHEVDERGWPTMNDDLYFRDQESEKKNMENNQEP